MYENNTILLIIPARGGSKRLPRKNILPLLGKPLIGWTIEQAKMSKYADRVIVSTDDYEIADIATKYGADIPFMRPRELAHDSTDIADVIVHIVQELENRGEQYDIIGVLEPTSPLRKKDDIDKAISVLVDTKDAEFVVSVGRIHLEHPAITKTISQDGFVQSYIKGIDYFYQMQQLDDAYFPYGVIYAGYTRHYLKHKKFYSDKTVPYFIDRWQNYEIDDYVDFIIVERIMMHNILCRGDISGGGL